MDTADISYAARSIADAIHVQVNAGRLTHGIDLDSIRCACAGFLACGTQVATAKEREAFEDLAWRMFAQQCV